LTLEIDLLKTKHCKELEELKSQSQNSLKDIQYIYEQVKLTKEKHVLQTKLDNIQKNAITNVPQADTVIEVPNTRLMEEIAQLNNKIVEIQIKGNEELNQLKVQKEELEKKIDILQFELTKASLNNRGSKLLQNKETKNTLNKAQKIIESKDNTIEEAKAYKKKITDLKNILTRYEGTEKRLKSLVNNKEKEVIELQNVIKNKINNEKYMHSEMNRIQSNFLNDKLNLEKELSVKNQFIENLLLKAEIKEEDTAKFISYNKTSTKNQTDLLNSKNNNQTRNIGILKDSLIDK